MFTTEEIKVIVLTLKTAVISTLFAFPISLTLGYLLARKNIPGKSIIEGLINIPLVAPPVVTGYLLLLSLGKNGFIGKWFSNMGMSLTFNFAALVIASVVVSLPLAVRNIKSAFELVDPMYEKASRSLGVSGIKTFFKVSVPLALPGIISGTVLSFARSLGEFGATITFAGNIPGKTQTLALLIYSDMQTPGKELNVTKLVVFSLVISMMAIILSNYINKKKKFLVK